MEVRDGFIISVFNYCDRWCERCPFTGRCRVFADIAEMHFEHDRGALTEPMEVRQAREMARHVERWEKTLGVDFDEIQADAERAVARGEFELPEVTLEDLETDTRAHDLGSALFNWLREERTFVEPMAKEAYEVIGHFSFFVYLKIHRALIGIADESDDGRWSDAEGSAKAALIGLDRMRTAWLALRESGEYVGADCEGFLKEIDFLIPAVERRLPRARAFVRPGFDEPDQLKRLEARELAGDEPDGLWNP